MEIISNSPPENVMAVGKFESMHLGHQALIHKAKAKSIALGLPLVVMSFYPHPATVLGPSEHRRLVPVDDTLRVLCDECRVDYYLKYPFTKAFSKLSPNEFCKILFVDLKVEELFVGEDYRFGAGRRGSTRELVLEAAVYGKKVTVVPFEKLGGKAISTSRIRELVAEGRYDEAHLLLGYKPSSFDVPF